MSVKRPGLAASRHRASAAKQAFLPAFARRPFPLAGTSPAAPRPRENRFAQRHSRWDHHARSGSLRDIPSASSAHCEDEVTLAGTAALDECLGLIPGGIGGIRLPGRCTRAGRARPLWLNLLLSHRGQGHLVLGSATHRVFEAIGLLGLVEIADVVVGAKSTAGRVRKVSSWSCLGLE